MTTTPVGLHEIAKRMKRTPGEIARLHANGELPKPRWIVNNGPAWSLDTIERWAAERKEPLPNHPPPHEEKRMTEHADHYEITIRVDKNIPDALRDALISQLAPRTAPIVGNLADAQRGAVT